MPPYKPAAERLIAKVSFDPRTHCMTFTGCTCSDGYGKMNGGRDFPGESLAHRVAYRCWNGEIPEGQEVDHRCGNRGCVNPQHLWTLTHAANVSHANHKENHRNAVKTHCIHGHEFTPENTIKEIWRGAERRKCRTCTNIGQARRRLERAAA